MDPVTHTLIGVGIGNAVFRKKIGSSAIPILAIASNLPDLDALAHMTGHPDAILMRRTLGHSLVTLPFLAFALSAVFKRFYPELKIGWLFLMVLVGALVHVFFDLVNSFGVVLFWPLSDWRPELGIIFIIDPILTTLIALPLLLSIPKTMRPHILSLSKGALFCIAFYTLFCGMNRAMALNTLTDPASQITPSDFHYVFPEPLGPHRWRGVSREGDHYSLFLIHSLSGKIEPHGTIETKTESPTVQKTLETPLVRRILWFFKAPVWNIVKNPESETVHVSIYDLRFKSLIIDRPIPFVFKFIVSKNGEIKEWKDR